MAVIKLPSYDTQQINQTYKPKYSASVQSGLFGKPNELVLRQKLLILFNSLVLKPKQYL